MTTPSTAACGNESKTRQPLPVNHPAGLYFKQIEYVKASREAVTKHGFRLFLGRFEFGNATGEVVERAHPANLFDNRITIGTGRLERLELQLLQLGPAMTTAGNFTIPFNPGHNHKPSTNMNPEKAS